MDSFKLLSSAACLSKPCDQKSATALYLEQLAACVPEFITTRNWTHPILDHFAPDFQAVVEHSEQPYIRSAKEYVDAYRKIATTYPKYRFDMVDVNADVDEARGTATIWMLMRVSGHPDETTVRESVVVGSMLRMGDKWFFTTQRSIRGLPIDT